MPADPLAIAAYLAERVDQGAAAALRQLRDRLTVQRSGLRPDGTALVETRQPVAALVASCTDMQMMTR